MNVRIIFNSYNIESMLATCVVINRLKKTTLDVQIETIGHTAGMAMKNKEVDITFCIGTTMSNMELVEEISLTNSFFLIVSKNGSNYLELLGDKGQVFSSDYMWGEAIEEHDKQFSPSLSKLTYQVLRRYFTIADEVQEEVEDNPNCAQYFKSHPKSPELRMMNAVEKFCWMQNPSIVDIYNVHNHLDKIHEGAFNGTGCEYNMLERDSDLTSNTPRITVVRNIIKKALAGHVYGKQNNSYVVQTINCSEEYLYDIVRLVSYAYESVIVYNDFKHYRQWWVYAKNPELMEKIANTIPFHEKHYDGKMIYLISDMPRLQDK
jgi:hypothetical protein